MADIKINVKTEGAEESLNSIAGIKKSIKDLRSQALAVGEGGKGFKQLTQQANELQDKLDDLKDSAKSLQGTGIEKLKSSFGLLTESFKNADFGKAKTAFQGLGSAMKAIPIFLIIEGIQYLVENFEKLSQGSGFLAKALQFVGDIITKVTEGITWLLNKLGLVNAELDKKSENLTKNAEKGKKAIEEQNTAYDQQIALLKSQGKSTVALEVAKQDAIIKTNQLLVQQTIDFVRSRGVLNAEQKQVLTQQLKAIKQASVDKQVVINTDIKTTSDAHKKAGDEQSKLDKERAENRLKKSQEEAAKLRELAEYARKQMADVNKMIANDAAKEESDRLKASQKALNDKINAQSEAKRKADEEDIKREGDALQRHYDMINSVNAVSSSLVGALRGINSDLSNLVSGMVTSMTSAFNVISDNSASTVDKIIAGLSAVGSLIGQISAYLMQEAQQQAQEVEDSYSRQSEALNTAKDEELAKEGLTAQQKIDIENKYKMQDYNLKILAYKKETEIKKKAFEQDKNLKIAQTVIATITGAVSALTGSIQALGMPYGAIFGAIAAAAVAAMGAQQVAQINKQKFDAGSPPQAPTLTPPSDVSSGAGGNGGGAQAGPNLYAAGQGDVNTGQGGPNGQRQSQPQKVYVVSQEVTSSQNMNAVIERRSSF